jgi:lysyl-tRNA synthetase class 2
MTLEDIRAERLKKIDLLREAGQSAYPVSSHHTHTIARYLTDFETLSASQVSVTLVGRVLSIREHGGLCFCTLFDGTGKIQGYLKEDEMDAGFFALFGKTVDSGDFVEATGMAFTTKRGEKSLLIKNWRMLAKSLLPIPTEWFGIQNEEERYRKRYLDIMLDATLAERIRLRSKFWNVFRQFLLERDFVEVETPVLETTTGGADARPFASHHNALNMEVFLRISSGELWQKRLMVAGIPRTFEIGRIFRNEGMSPEHAQDYTQLEFYQAYADFTQGMQMLTELYRRVATEVFGKTTFTIKGHTVDLGAEWEMYDFCDLVKKHSGIDPLDESVTLDVLENALREAHIEYKKEELNRPRAVDLIWKGIRKTLSGPGFLVNVPVYLEPLAKRSEKDDRIVERFQIIIAGSEVGKGFSELNDPRDQRARFEEQQRMRDAGDEEAQMADWEYVEAMEHGMPPSFGFGVSERLFSFLLDVPIREAQIFPLLKPKAQELSKKEAESLYRSKKFVVIADSSQGHGVAANAIGQLGISIGGLISQKIFNQETLTDKDGKTHYVDGLFPMTNLAGDQKVMAEFMQKCYDAKIQVFDFSLIMRKAHSDAEMEKGYRAVGTADIPYLAVGALIPADFEKEFLSSLQLYS